MDQRLETFLTVCSTMNYRRAAERLHLTQPAVTKQIQALEALYGVRLFTYDSRKLKKRRRAKRWRSTPSASAIRTRSCAARSGGRKRRACASARRNPSATIFCRRRSADFSKNRTTSCFLPWTIPHICLPNSRAESLTLSCLRVFLTRADTRAFCCAMSLISVFVRKTTPFRGAR